MLSRMGGNRTALLFAAAASLLLVVVAARGRSPVPSELNDLRIERGLPGVLSGARSVGVHVNPDADVDPALAAKVVVGLLVVLCVMAVVFSVLSFLRRRRLLGVGKVVESVEAPALDSVPRFRLKEAVEQARDVLAREGGRPGDAVIAAWVTLENATEHRRQPHETATEFTVALLTEEHADEAALAELRTLYQRARFGHDDVDAGSATRARAALDRILATIR
jgi:Na+-transporting methylmalonyl-CoA/oxaloacetate decarboxylase gamma subunit